MSDQTPEQPSNEPAPAGPLQESEPIGLSAEGEPIERPVVEMAPPGVPEPPSIPPMSRPSEFASNYPRAGQNILGYVRPPGVYWDTIGTAFSMITANWTVYVLSNLLMVLMIGAVYGAMLPFMFRAGFANLLATQPGGVSSSMSVAMLVPQLLIQFVSCFGTLCLISVGVRHAQGSFPSISDFLIPFQRFPKALFASLLIFVVPAILTVISGLGQSVLHRDPGVVLVFAMILLLLNLPVYLFWYGPSLLAATASVFNGGSPVDNLSKLATSLGVQTLLLGLLVFVSGVIGGLGLIACCVGILFTYPIMTNVVALHYIYIFPEDNAPEALSQSPA